MDLPNKSDTGPQPQKKNIQQVGSGIVQVKRPATRRILDYLFAESPKAMGAKIGRDIIVPRLKAALEESANSFLHGMLWNGGNPPMSGIVKSPMIRPGGATQYHNITTLNTPTPPAPSKQVGNYRDLVIPTQEMSEIILANMYDLLNQYRIVTVADLYELAGITPSISDNSYGWTSLDGARISKVREGYLLELPRPAII